MLPLIICILVVSSLASASEANTEADGLVWQKVAAPTGNLVWRKVTPLGLVGAGPFIKINQPSDLVTWNLGQQAVISWSAGNFPAAACDPYFRIELHRVSASSPQTLNMPLSDQTFVTTITHSTPACPTPAPPAAASSTLCTTIDGNGRCSGSGSFLWQVQLPEYLHGNQYYRVQIVSLDDTSVYGLSDGKFRIVNRPT